MNVINKSRSFWENSQEIVTESRNSADRGPVREACREILQLPSEMRQPGPGISSLWNSRTTDETYTTLVPKTRAIRQPSGPPTPPGGHGQAVVLGTGTHPEPSRLPGLQRPETRAARPHRTERQRGDAAHGEPRRSAEDPPSQWQGADGCIQARKLSEVKESTGWRLERTAKTEILDMKFHRMEWVADGILQKKDKWAGRQGKEKYLKWNPLR